jgi:hypothetical protein
LPEPDWLPLAGDWLGPGVAELAPADGDADGLDWAACDWPDCDWPACDWPACDCDGTGCVTADKAGAGRKAGTGVLSLAPATAGFASGAVPASAGDASAAFRCSPRTSSTGAGAAGRAPDAATIRAGLLELVVAANAGLAVSPPATLTMAAALAMVATAAAAPIFRREGLRSDLSLRDGDLAGRERERKGSLSSGVGERSGRHSRRGRSNRRAAGNAQ